MISKLPPWIGAGAWLLAFIAGMVNMVGLHGFEHQAISHLTGTTSLLAASVAALDLNTVIHLAAIIGSFVAGSVMSGLVIQDSALQIGARYGIALTIESLLLLLAVPFLYRSSGFGVYAASCACGLQNAMVSTYSGSILRTTHLSGMFTDLGIYLGHAMRGIPVDMRRLRLCIIVISGFLVGGIAGSLIFHRWGYNALLIPSALTGIVACTYGFYRVKRTG